MTSQREGGERSETALVVRRPRLATVLSWSGALVALGLLIATLLLLPFQLLAVRTGSMAPTIGVRAAVLVHTGEYREGEPIAFTHSGVVITHRLVSVNPDGTLVTKGDANDTPDPWVVRPTDVIGGVVGSVPALGYWLVYLKSGAGFASVAFAVAAMMLMWPLGKELDAARDAARDAAAARATESAQPTSGT